MVSKNLLTAMGVLTKKESCSAGRTHFAPTNILLTPMNVLAPGSAHT